MQTRSYKEIYQQFEDFRLNNELFLWRLHYHHLEDNVLAQDLYSLLLEAKQLLTMPNQPAAEIANLKFMQLYLASWLILRSETAIDDDPKLPLYLAELIPNLKPFKTELLYHCNYESLFEMLYYCLDDYLSSEKAEADEHLETLLDYLDSARHTSWEMVAICFQNYCKIYSCKLSSEEKDKVFKIIEVLFNQYINEAEKAQPLPRLPLASMISSFGSVKMNQSFHKNKNNLFKLIESSKAFISETPSFTKIFDYIEFADKTPDWYIAYTNVVKFLNLQIKQINAFIIENPRSNYVYPLLIDCEPLVIQLEKLLEMGKAQIQTLKNLDSDIKNYKTLKHIIKNQGKFSEKIVYQFRLFLLNWNKQRPKESALKNDENMQALIFRQMTLIFNQLQKDNITWNFEYEDNANKFELHYTLLTAIQHMPESQNPDLLSMQIYMKVFFANSHELQSKEPWSFTQLLSSKNPEFKYFTYPKLLQESSDALKVGINTGKFSLNLGFYRMLEGYVQLISKHKEKNPKFDLSTEIRHIFSYFPKKKNKIATPEEKEVTEILNKIHTNIYLLFFNHLDKVFLDASFTFVQNHMNVKKGLINQQKIALGAPIKLSYLIDLSSFFKMEIIRSSSVQLSFRESIQMWNKYFPQLFGILKEDAVLSADSGKHYSIVLAICISFLKRIRNSYFEINKDDFLDMNDLKHISTVLFKRFFPLNNSEKKYLRDNFSSLAKDMKKLHELGVNNKQVIQWLGDAHLMASSSQLVNYLDDVIQLMNQCIPSGKEVIEPAKAIDYSSLDLKKYLPIKTTPPLEINQIIPRQTLNQPTKSLSNSNPKPTLSLPVNLKDLETRFRIIHKTFMGQEPQEQQILLNILDQVMIQLSDIENQIEKTKDNLVDMDSLKINVFCTKIHTLIAYNNESKHPRINTYSQKIMDLFIKYSKKSNTKNHSQTSSFELDLHLQRNIFICFEAVLLKTSDTIHDSILKFLHNLLSYTLPPYIQMVILELRSRYIKLSTQEMTLYKTASKQQISEDIALIHSKLLSCNITARDIRTQNWSENLTLGSKKSDGSMLVSCIPDKPGYYLKALITWERDYYLPIIQILSMIDWVNIHKDIDQTVLLKNIINTLFLRLQEEANTLTCLCESDFSAGLHEEVKDRITIISKYTGEILTIVGNIESILKNFSPLWRKRILALDFDKKNTSDPELETSIATLNERYEFVYYEYHKQIHCNRVDKIHLLNEVLTAVRNDLELKQHKYHFSDALSCIDVKLTLMESSIASTLKDTKKANELWKTAEKKFLNKIQHTAFKNDRILQKCMLECYAKILLAISVEDAKEVLPKILLLIEHSAIPEFRQMAKQYMDYFLAIHADAMPELCVPKIKLYVKDKPNNIELLESLNTLYLLAHYIASDKTLRDNLRGGSLNQFLSHWQVFHNIYFVPSVTKLQNHAWHSLHAFKTEFPVILKLIHALITEASNHLHFIEDLIDISHPAVSTLQGPINYIYKHLQTLDDIISSGKTALKETDFAEWIAVLEERLQEKITFCAHLNKQLESKIETSKIKHLQAAEQAERNAAKLLAQHEEELDSAKTPIFIPDEDYDLFDEEAESDSEEDLPQETIDESYSEALKNAQQLDRDLTNALRELNYKLTNICNIYKNRMNYRIPLYVRRSESLQEDMGIIFSLYHRVVRYQKDIVKLQVPEAENNASIQQGFIFLQEYMQKSMETTNKRIDLLLKYAQKCHELNRKSRDAKIWSLGIEFYTSQLNNATDRSQALEHTTGNRASFQPIIDAETLSRLQHNPHDADAATRSLILSAGTHAFIALGRENRKNHVEKCIYFKERELFQTLTPIFASINYCYKDSQMPVPGEIEIPWHFFKSDKIGNNKRIFTKDDYTNVINQTPYRKPLAVLIPQKQEQRVPAKLNQEFFDALTNVISTVSESIRSKEIDFTSVRLLLVNYHEVFNLYEKFRTLKENHLLIKKIDPLIDALNRQIFEDYLNYIHEDYISFQKTQLKPSDIESEGMKQLFFRNCIPFLATIAYYHDLICKLQGKQDNSLVSFAKLPFFHDSQAIDPDYVLAEAIRFISETTECNPQVIERCIGHYQKSLESSKDPVQIAKTRYAVLNLKLLLLKSGFGDISENYETLLKEFYMTCVFVMQEMREFHIGKEFLEISNQCYHNLYSNCVEQADATTLQKVIAFYRVLVKTPMRYELLMIDSVTLDWTILELKRVLLLKYPKDVDFSLQMLFVEFQTLIANMKAQENPDSRLLERAEAIMHEFSITVFENPEEGETNGQVSIPKCSTGELIYNEEAPNPIRILTQDKQPLSDTGFFKSSPGQIVTEQKSTSAFSEEGHRDIIGFFGYGNKKEGSKTTDDLSTACTKQRKRSFSQ